MSEQEVERRGRERLPGAAWAICGVVVAVLVAVSPRYGWHRDELYFLQAGRNLDWGYIDQPPFTPFVARVADELARHDLVAIRVPAAAATGITVLLGAAIVRELGAARRGQILGAAAVAAGGFVLGAGHLLSTATFDVTFATALFLVTVRLLRTGEPRWWVAFGGVAGAALLNKHLIVLPVLALLVGLAVERRWDLLRSSWLLAGGALAAVVAAPNLVWQAANGWPQLDMAGALSERLAAESRALLIPSQALFLGPLLVPLLWWGGRWLWPDQAARPFRPLLWAWPVGLALTFASGGRPYYAFPLTLLVALVGVAADDRRPEPRRALPWLVAANAAIVLPLALPLLPLSMMEPAVAANEALAETVGWPELVEQVAAVVEGLPSDERRRVVLLTASYGEAGALDRFGPEHGLPPAHSAHNSYADFRRPAYDGATVVAVRYRMEHLEPHFEQCEQVAEIEVVHDIPNEINGTPILVCRGLRGTWDEVWPRLRHLS